MSLTLSKNSATLSAQKCDPTLLAGLNPPAPKLCYENLQITISPSNTSEFIVPVMIVKPGTTTQILILYRLSGEVVAHPGPPQNVTSAEVPVMRSVPSGNASGEIRCSPGSLVYGSPSIVIYSYNITALAGSDGYYAISPVYYVGFYPVLAVGASPGHLNETALSTWGYDGPVISGEFMVPSMIVGTGNATIVNATVPTVQTCPSPVCVTIAHSVS